MDLLNFPTATTASENAAARFLALQVGRMDIGFKIFNRCLDAVLEALENSDFVWLLDVLLSGVDSLWGLHRQFVVSICDVPSPFTVRSYHGLS